MELSKSHLKIGDRVRFKKPKRNPIRGTIDAIKSDLHNMKWAPNGCPLNVVVKVDKIDKNGIFYGTELITTNMKKLIASF